MGKYDYLIGGRTTRTGGKYDYLITAKKPVAPVAAPVRRTGVLGGLQELESDVRRVVTAPFPKQSWNPLVALKSTYQSAKDTLGNSLIDRPKAALSAIFDRNSTPAERVSKTGEAGLGLINAAFVPITAPLQGATNLPVVGSAAEIVNRFFGVLGTVGSDIGEGVIETLPVTDETKKAITPLAQEVGALVAQIAAGKAGGGKKAAELKTKVREIATHIDNGLLVADKVAKGDIPKTLNVKATESTGQPKIVRKGATPNELRPLAQEAKKYKSAEEFVSKFNHASGQVKIGDSTFTKVYRATTESFDPTKLKTSGKATGLYVTPRKSYAEGFLEEGRSLETLLLRDTAKILTKEDIPQSLRVGTETLKKYAGPQGLQDRVAQYAKQNGFDAVDYAGNGQNLIILNPEALVTKSQLTDLWNKVNRESKQAEAQTVPNTRARTLEQAAIEKKLTDSLGELPSHARMDMTDQASLASDFIKKSPDEALRAARGDTTPPPGILPEALYTALEIKAIKEGNVELLRDLATSKVPTFAGQSLKALDSADPYSPVKIMRDLKEAREAAVERRTGKKVEQHTKDIVKDIKREVQKSSSKRPTWEEFVKEIQC